MLRTGDGAAIAQATGKQRGVEVGHAAWLPDDSVAGSGEHSRDGGVPGAWYAYFLTLLAETYGKTGQTEAGLAVLAEALDTLHKTGERWCEAEIYRLKGELLWQQVQGKRPQTKIALEAEACVQPALGIARQQHTKSLELRAALSLSRLWQHQGKCEEARQLLAEIAGWFTEGFDAADVAEARALLQELGV